jgi:hypothetical protein
VFPVEDAAGDMLASTGREVHMSWPLVFLLSLFGLAMGIATVFVVPSSVEPLFWIVIFVVCAYIIAKAAPGRPFLHGLAVGVANSVWITTAHVLLFDQYIARHSQEAQMMASLPWPGSPRIMMAITGPVIGVVSGVVLGLFALVAARLVRRSASAGEARA